MEHYHGGFYLIGERDIKDFGGVALHLRHENGMEVLHLKCGDFENLFAFVFRTPVMDSKGLPHIMEHSVLCGSQKYPLKEPFVNLMNMSVNTFLNAMTYPDMTVYPASSVNIKDYYNLMSVYADAVFFPLLTENAFMQEAHRLELDEKGGASIQGVVYNEMKGAYSSFASVASDAQIAAMMAGTCYERDFGGDPLEVARLTYQEFKDFHKKYYRPSNCLLFLYGNESTENQLDFLESNFLNRLKETSIVCRDDIKRMMQSVPFTKQVTVQKDGPDSDTSGKAVTLNYRVARMPYTLEDMIKSSFLMQLLAGNDASPVAKALNESSLGDRLMCGINANVSDYILYFGLGGVAEGNDGKVKDLILKELMSVKKAGFTADDINGAILAIDFALREKVRTADGPFSLFLMEKVSSFWAHGSDPVCVLPRIDAFESFKEKLRSFGSGSAEDQSAFCVSLLEKMVLENKDSAFSVVSPKASYIRVRGEKERDLTDELFKAADKGALKKRLKELHEAQGKKESADEAACIPSLLIKDLSPEIDPIATDIFLYNGSDILPAKTAHTSSTDAPSNVAGAGDNGIPLITSRAETNGIVYFKMLFPADVLPKEDLPYLNLLGAASFCTGANGKKWDEAIRELSYCTGGVAAAAMTGTPYNSELSRAYFESVKQYNFIGRDWMCFSFKTPREYLGSALPLFTSMLLHLDFSDENRLKTIINEEYDDIRSSIIPGGARAALMRSRCSLTRENALDEIWNGISQLFTMRRIANAPASETGARLTDIMKKIIDGGTLVHITADNDSMKKTALIITGENSPLRHFKPLLPRKSTVDDKALYDLTLLRGQTPDMNNITYTLKSQVGFAAMCYRAADMGCPPLALDYERDAAATALCRYLESNVLWEAIRTKGGAYGANASVNSRSAIASFSTYRDPKPYRSLEAIKECIDSLTQKNFLDEEVKHLITGSYSDFVEPLSPYRYGAQGLINALYGITNDDRKNMLKALLALNKEMLHNETCALKKSMDLGVISSVIAQDAIGTAIDLGL